MSEASSPGSGSGTGSDPSNQPDARETSAASAANVSPRESWRASRGVLGWLRRFAKLWGFALFCVFVVYTFREVALPFLFAILVAYILSPLVDRFARLKVRGRPFPRGLAVVILYINIIAALVFFVSYFIPKLSSDFARLFKESPHLIARVNRDWVPRVGAWIDDRFGASASESADESAAETDAASEVPVRESHQAPPRTSSEEEGDARADAQLSSRSGGPTGDEITFDVDDPSSGEPPRRPVTSARQGRYLLLETLPDGTQRLNLDALALELRPLAGGKYLITAPKPAARESNEGKWERSIKQWVAERIKSTEGQSRRALEWGQRFVAGVVTGIARLVLVLMVAAFILVDLARLRRFLRSLVPEQYGADYDRILAGIDRGLSGVIRGQLVICLINGVLTYVGVVLFHVKYPLLLAGLACVMSLVPIFGSVLSSIPIVAVALISSGSFDLLPGVKILAWIVGIHLVEANFLNPKIMGDAAKIHPVLVVFALIAGEHSYGLVGALFAVPVASIMQTMFVYFRRRPRQRIKAEAAAAR